MIYGMYLSTMGALVQSQRHATISNNLANTNTHGFKPDWSIFVEVPVEDEFHPERRFYWDEILMKTGGGVWNDTTITNLAEGPLHETGNTFDVALHDDQLSGMNSFFMIAADGDDAETFYTRDGHFVPDENGVLRTVTGYRVLSPEGGTITIAPPENSIITIRDDGVIMAVTEEENIELGVIGVMRTAEGHLMKKVGDSRFIAQGAEMENWQSGVKSGYLEVSATNAIDEMTNMIEASRIYETNMRFLTIQDETLGQTVRRVGAASTA